MPLLDPSSSHPTTLLAMKHVSPLSLLLTSAALALGLTACSKHAHPAADTASALPVAEVKVHVTGQASHEAFEEAVGTVRARLRAIVEAKVSARLEQMPVVAGQAVKAGDLLAQLDAREIQARLDQALALREQANADLQRFSALLAQEAVTRSEYDAVQTRQRVAQGSVVEAETMLAYTRVLAPFDGVVTRKYADVGDLAAPGRPLMELEDPTGLRLEANIPEALIGHIRQGSSLKVSFASLDDDLEGVVSEIAPTSDPNTRTFLAKIDLPEVPGIRAGLFGRAAIPVGEFSALRIPAAAVLHRGQLEIVYVIEDHHARLRLVKTGKPVGQEIEILSGISTNESVVVEGLTGLLDGQPVKLID